MKKILFLIIFILSINLVLSTPIVDLEDYTETLTFEEDFTSITDWTVGTSGFSVSSGVMTSTSGTRNDIYRTDLNVSDNFMIEARLYPVAVGGLLTLGIGSDLGVQAWALNAKGYGIYTDQNQNPDRLGMIVTDSNGGDGWLSSFITEGNNEGTWQNFTMTHIEGNNSLYINGVFKHSFINDTWTDDMYIADIYFYGSGHKIDFMNVYNLTYLALPINITSYNCTSCYQNNDVWNTNKLLQPLTKDNTPTISITTDEISNCSIGTNNYNYTDMITNDANTECSTSSTTNHTCTLPTTQKLVSGDNNIYISCTGIGDYQNSTSTSGILNISMDYTIIEEEIYNLDGDGTKSTTFNNDDVETIENVVLNFSVDTTDNFNLKLNFTADGLNGCSLGNLQNLVCYNYDNSTYQWIEFINGTNTTTFDARTEVTGDRIIYSLTTNATHTYFDFLIDEHYNPNVFKLYGSQFNFSDVKFQTGNNQRITGDNYIIIQENNTLIPGTADLYKLELRVNHSQGVQLPTEPLEKYLCNSSYTTGDFSESPACVLVGLALPEDLTDDGTKFRSLFNNNLIQQLGDVSILGLKTDLQSPNKYYSIKTYKTRASNYTQKWEYSTDAGLTYNNLNDGYESEANINWFNDGADPTQFRYSIYIESDETRGEITGNYTWNITANQNYPPLIDIVNPPPLSNITLPYNITFFTSDTNNNFLDVEINLYYPNGSLYKQITNVLDETDTYYYYNDTGIDGNYLLELKATEKGTTELYNVSDTHNITINFYTVPTTTPTGVVVNIGTEEISEGIKMFTLYFVWVLMLIVSLVFRKGSLLMLTGLFGFVITLVDQRYEPLIRTVLQGINLLLIFSGYNILKKE